MTARSDFKPAAPDQIARELGARLAALRVARYLSREQLAERAEIDSRTLEQFEAGEGASLDTLIRLIQALGLDAQLAALLQDRHVQPVHFERGAQAVTHGGARRWHEKEQQHWS